MYYMAAAILPVSSANEAVYQNSQQLKIENQQILSRSVVK